MTDSHPPENSTSRALRRIEPPSQRALAYPIAAQVGSSSGENLVSPSFLWWVFQQWWKVCIPVGAVLAAIAGASVVFLHVPKFKATAMLTIEDTSPYIAFSKTAGGDRSGQYIQTQLALLRSPVVLEPVVGRPEVAAIAELATAADPVEVLQENLLIERLGGSELYNISYVSTVPKSAAAVVNGVVEEYLRYHAQDDTSRTQRVIDLLEEERVRRSLEVERQRKRLVNLAEEVTGKDPYSGAVTDISRAESPMGSLFQSLTQLDMESELLKAQKQAIVEGQARAVDPFESSTLLKIEIEKHAETQRRVQLIASLRAELEQIKADAIRDLKNPQWETRPSYVAGKKQLDQLEKSLEEWRAELKESLLAERREQRKIEQQSEISKIDFQLNSIDVQRQQLSDLFKEELVKRQAGKGKSVELEFARTELAREETVFGMIASRKLALQTEMRAPARINKIREARVPVAPIEPVPYKMLLMACAVAVCAPFGLVLLKEILDRRISDVDQLSQESRLRVLGEIAQLPVRNVAVSPHKLSGRVQRDAHVFAESINSLRTNLFLAEDLRDKQVFAITSPISGESKSSIAVSLSMSIANSSGKPTLIIDADMRSPDVASMLKTKAHPGLFEVLSGGCELEKAIQHVSESSLYVMPAGRATRSTHHLVKVDELKKLLDRLRPKFGTIVIDTPPILGASEAIVLAKAADAALLCSMSGKSKVKQLKMAVERLEHAGVNVAGTVLSGSSVSRYAYRYGYYPIENGSGK